MTLIQTLLAERLVILVADRRLTWPDGSLADDNFTKSGRMAGRLHRSIHRHLSN